MFPYSVLGPLIHSMKQKFVWIPHHHFPWALGTAPDATIAAEPLEDAPLENSVCQGLKQVFRLEAL